MKYIGMPMWMWVLFGKSFERNLITEFGLDRDTAKMTAARAKLRYKDIIGGLPEFEKADRFKMNIVNCALLSAFVLNMPKRPDVKRFWEEMKKYSLIGKIGSVLAGKLNNRLAVYRWRAEDN